MRPLELLKLGNKKLGPGIWKVSLEEIRTCPGRGDCAEYCFITKVAAPRPDYRNYLKRCTDLAMGDLKAYEEQLMAELALRKPRIVRIHEGGDFFNEAHIDMWRRITMAHKDILFFGYTTSWRIKKLRRKLVWLRKQKNVSLYASVEPKDLLLNRLRHVESWPKAHVVKHDHDLNDPLVCDEYNGTDTCSSCLRCIIGDKDVLFPQRHKHTIKQTHGELYGTA